MCVKSEEIIEKELITQLVKLGYEAVDINNEDNLKSNLRKQIEEHNDVVLSDDNFADILHRLSKGKSFDKAKVLRESYPITLEDGTETYIEFLDQINWCKNKFQVSSQISVDTNKGRTHRYDVTLFINGLPLVQIEVKKSGIELKKAFGQTQRYKRESYGASAGLFEYIQIFVISNSVNTLYYANNKKLRFEQTFTWSDEDNKSINYLDKFTDKFLEPCHISKMICKYIVLTTDGLMMVLRPYQYYAIEEIVDRVKNSNKNGFIWHTTGSGKTLTSFKASQIITNMKEIKKVVFVVDRKDLDIQTTEEFNSFSEGSVDGTENTRALVKQFSDNSVPMIVTTIQKLNTAINKKRFEEDMQPLADEKIVFIFDECHRSQFGKSHTKINGFFKNAQLIGFTGTPIRKENTSDKAGRITENLFDKCLHKYLIPTAIKDKNVLPLSVEYIGDKKREDKKDLKNPSRLEAVVDYIISEHNTKTKQKKYTAMMCVSKVDVLIAYYDLFQKKKEEGKHDLKIATIFSYGVNEDEKDIDDSDVSMGDIKMVDSVRKDILSNYIQDYNKMFGGEQSVEEYYKYYQDIAKRVKRKDVDILLVVNMFLTGFDSKPLNTLYVDKNLSYHGLVQAFSRTNRIYDKDKHHGQIVCFRDLKHETDKAIAFFSEGGDYSKVLIDDYESYVEKFNLFIDVLKKLVPTVESVDELEHEEAEKAFAKAFRDLIRTISILETFTDFDFKDLNIQKNEYEDYKTKYIDLAQRTGDGGGDKPEITEIDFELELLQKDEINVFYILTLLEKLKNTKLDKQEALQKQIDNIINNNPALHKQKEILKGFMKDYLINKSSDINVEEQYELYKVKKRDEAFIILCQKLGFDELKAEQIIEKHLHYRSIKIDADDVYEIMIDKPSLFNRTDKENSAIRAIINFVDKYHL